MGALNSTGGTIPRLACSRYEGFASARGNRSGSCRRQDSRITDPATALIEEGTMSIANISTRQSWLDANTTTPVTVNPAGTSSSSTVDLSIGQGEGRGR